MENREKYLELVKTFKTQARYKKFIWERDLPPLAEILKEFGSWNAAKSLVTKQENLRIEKETYLKDYRCSSTFLYLVYFWEEDFYKVGITTEGVRKRFRSFPPYKEIDKILLGNKEAKEAELYILKKIDNPYTPLDKKFINGHTECFKSKYVPNLNQLLEGSNMAWTTQEEEELIKLHSSGLSVKDIAEVLGRAPGTVANKCTRLNLLKMPRWTESEEQALIKLSNEGQSIQRIALRLNRTEGSIKQKISRLLKDIDAVELKSKFKFKKQGDYK